ncbi:GATOR complex protein Wdr59 isoform X1 [Episyrphus balteatus]|uniref:GATOR complex protein Wdr59 isoform X1 n=2 Tax=Episyrphus balteatus TaxID=286459 RepID=UPI00248530F2|nr:GATOR complex protein Wdr59 isoform X1 [Episyrphus balteatus]
MMKKMSSSDGMREQSFIIRQSTNAYEHRDSLATAMSVDYSGQWVLLAGRRYLALQRLGQDDSTLRKYHRNSKYEVSSAEFAICHHRQEYCAIATSQLIEVVTWGSSEPQLIHSLRGHTRMVTDIDWHSKNPNLLVSCSIDTFSHIWDLRDARKPHLSLSAVCMSGATQVGFNRVSGNLLAAAHDGDLRIWDIRKGTCPTHYITAHLNRVHGINWSHMRETCLATASQDGTVKYFDVNNPRRAEKIITTSSPVWRARYTPVGNGLVSIVVPHLGRGENSLLLWSNSKQTDPVCSFVGHTDVILDFDWRPNHEDSSEIELVTWSRDRTLRVWKIDDTLLKLCEPVSSDIEEEVDAMDALQIARSPVKSESIARSLTDQPTCSLHHEFSLFNTNIPHVEVDVLDAIKRNAIFKISAAGYVVVLRVNFPVEYPSPNMGPEFLFCQGTTLTDHLSMYLLKVLKTNALQRVKKSRTCLEQCVRALVAALKKSIGGSDKSQMRLQSPRLEGALSGAIHDACIPFPRTSGAKFNASGLLVTFAQSFNTKRLTLRNQNVTPRTLSAISGGCLLGNVMGPQPVLYAHRDSNASFYLQERLAKSSKNRSLQKATTNAVVHIYDVHKLLNINKELAQEYKLSKTDVIGACQHNRQMVENHGRTDLAPIWKLAEMIATPNIPNEANCEMLFLQDPFKKFLLESLINHYATKGDLQTAVMLCCVFHKCPPETEPTHFGSKMNLTTNGSPYHTVLPVDKHSNRMCMLPKHMRSNSWSDPMGCIDSNVINSDNYSCSLLRKSKMPMFDSLKKAYGDILFSWQLLNERALILKHTMYQKPPTHDVDFVTECAGCNKTKRTAACGPCQKLVLFCTLCRLPVKGAANACLACGHGGHVEHMQQWFEKHDLCASGCGCYCLKESHLLLDHLD